jgi:predicted transcriptional regulator
MIPIRITQKQKGGDMMIFPKLAGLMAVNKMSHKQLSKIIGCSQQAASKKLDGKIEFKRSEMQKIKRYFQSIDPNVTVDELFEEYIFLPV